MAVGVFGWLQLVQGAAFLLAGAIAWKSRPGNRTGALMVAYGLAQLVGRALFQLKLPGTVTPAILITDGAMALFVYLLLVFPSGVLSARRDRLILVPLLLVVGPIQIAWLLFFELDGYNALLVWPDPGVASAIDLVQRLTIAIVDAALVTVLIRRFVRASPPLRRSLAPVLVGALALAAGAFSLLWNRFVGQETEAIVWVTALTFIALPIAFLATLLRARLARSAVGELLVDLRAHDSPSELPGALARALGDPSLQLAYWLPEFETYVDLAGQPVTVPEEGSSRAVTALEGADGRRVAALVHDPSLHQEGDLLRQVSAAAAIALENARLQADLRARLEELRGSRARVIEAADAERRKLERDLHDGAQRRLVTLSMSLGLLETRLEDPETRALVAEAKREASGSLQELRDLAQGIHPAVLTGHGLAVALESLVAASPVPVGLDIDLAERLPEPAEVAAYFLISEALTNTTKHAHASRADVAVHRENGSVIVEVTDDGVGGAATEHGSGLRGLADRVEALEGSLRVWSPDGGGTRLRAEIPCA
jgi:signal transduction histidine kinase